LLAALQDIDITWDNPEIKELQDDDVKKEYVDWKKARPGAATKRKASKGKRNGEGSAATSRNTSGQSGTTPATDEGHDGYLSSETLQAILEVNPERLPAVEFGRLALAARGGGDMGRKLWRKELAAFFAQDSEE
jgi:hypothetical protein